MTGGDGRFALRAIRRQRLFLGLSIAGLTIAGALIVLLILLNARQNLRQYKYARLLAGFMVPGAR